MTVRVAVQVNGVPVEVELGDDALAQIAAALPAPTATHVAVNEPSKYLSIKEAAELLRTNRERIDDLLYRRKLGRVKEGARTLIERAELERYLNGGGR